MIDCHKKSTLINSNGQSYKLCLLKFSLAQRCWALSAPLRPKEEQESALPGAGFQEGTASSSAAPARCGCPNAAGDAAWVPSKGPPSSRALGWVVEGIGLSPFCWRKKCPLRYSFLLFALLDCSVLRDAKKVKQLQWFQQSFKHRVSSNTGFQMLGLFLHYSTSWTAEKGNNNSICKMAGEAKQLEGQESGKKKNPCRCRREEKVNSVCRTLLSWIYSLFPCVNTLNGS